jgi:hypothetical protein
MNGRDFLADAAAIKDEFCGLVDHVCRAIQTGTIAEDAQLWFRKQPFREGRFGIVHDHDLATLCLIPALSLQAEAEIIQLNSGFDTDPEAAPV